MNWKLCLLVGCLAVVPRPAFKDPSAAAVGQQHWVTRAGQRLSLWERTEAETPETVGATGQVVLFLHGATWSGRPNFDLQFEDYSAMEALAARGWDTFCLDVQGYGVSADPVAPSACRAAEAVLDVHAAVEYLVEQRGVERVHLVGWSWGSQVAGLYAEEHPGRVARLVLYGSRWQPLGFAPDAPAERFRSNERTGAFGDLVEGCYDPAMVEFYADAAIAADPESPNGALMDYFGGLPVLDPEEIKAPTMLVLGEHEARTKMEDQMAFFSGLPNFDKRFVVLPGGGHAIHLERPRARWWAAVGEFLEG